MKTSPNCFMQMHWGKIAREIKSQGDDICFVANKGNAGMFPSCIVHTSYFICDAKMK